MYWEGDQVALGFGGAGFGDLSDWEDGGRGYLSWGLEEFETVEGSEALRDFGLSLVLVGKSTGFCCWALLSRWFGSTWLMMNYIPIQMAMAFGVVLIPVFNA